VKRTERFEMRVSPEWLAKLDKARGDTSRASYIHDLVERTAASPRNAPSAPAWWGKAR
jgi:hypothetical protein